MSIEPVLAPWPDMVDPTGNYYTIPDIGRLPRVTGIIKATNGIWSEGLRNWYASAEREAVLAAVRDQFGWAAGMDGAAFVRMVEQGIGQAKAAIKKMNAAADIGTEAHKAIQARLRAELGLPNVMPVLGDGATIAYMAWEEWWEQAGFKPVRVEQTIWHAGLKYAGTIDLIAEKDGRLWVLDWKSANCIVLDHHIQVACYVEAARLWAPIEGALIVRVPKTLEKLAIEVKPLGHLYNPSSRKEFRRSHAQLMESFKALRTLYGIYMEVEWTRLMP